MKDPVTLTTGITYDRDSIEQWLFTNNNNTCPVTKQLLPNDNSLILTPNHTLLHIIQSWCSQKTSSSSYAIDLFQVLKLLKNLSNPRNMKKLELMIIENERNKKCLLEAGVPKAMIMFIMTCFKEGQPDKGVKEALRILQFVNIPQEEIKLLSPQHDQILDSLTWVLGCEFENSVTVKSHAVLVLKAFMKNASSRVMERLKPEFFERIV
ncbi:hypothetical protein RIF29_39623 [Crotalaria pallida]|uniref:U-box domain-containing protein n=1 Tax=Crotalaria pallida TaxID=3830 RepID=A0AAN9E374_CROPI